MPAAKKDGRYSSNSGTISLGDFKLPPTPESVLGNAQPMSAPQASILPQLDDAKRYQELKEKVHKEMEAKDKAIKDKEAVDAKLQEANAKVATREVEVKTLQQQVESKTTEMKALDSKVTEAKVARADEITTQQDLAAAAQSKPTEAQAALNAEKDKVTKAAADLTGRTNELTDTRTKLTAAEAKYETSEKEQQASLNDVQDLRARGIPNEDDGTENGLWILLAHYGGVDYTSNGNVRRRIREAMDKKWNVGPSGFIATHSSWTSLFDGNDPRPGTQKSIVIVYRWNKTGHINIVSTFEDGTHTF